MPAPTNDSFANSDSFVGDSGSVAGTTFDATKEGTESTTIFAGSSAQSVWWDFTPSVTGWYRIWMHDADITYHGVYNFDNTELGLEVFPNGALTDMTSTNRMVLGWRETANDYGIEVAVYLTASTTYYIRVTSSKTSSTTNSKTADFTLHWENFTPPANNDLANVVDLGAEPVAATGVTTLNATMESGEVLATTLSSSYDREQSVWYKFTPSVSGKYGFGFDNFVQYGDAGIQCITQVSTQSTLAGYTPANELTRFTFSVGQFLPTARFIQYVDLVGGTTYYIRISTPWATLSSANGGAFNGSAVSFDLDIDIISPPSNDDFANAIALSTTLPASLTISPFDATADSGQSTTFPFSVGDQTIWYTFTPTVTGKYRFRVPRSSLVYDGAGTSPDNGFVMFGISAAATVGTFTGASLIGGIGYVDYNVTRDVDIFADLTASTTYHICVWMDGTPFNLDSMTFDLEWQLMANPANDDLADAIAIGGASGSTEFDIMLPTLEASEQYPWIDTPPVGTLWWAWLCPSTGDYAFRVECTIDYNLTYSEQYGIVPIYEIGIWQGSTIGSLTKIRRNQLGAQNEEGRTLSNATVVGFHAVGGQTYKIQVSPSTLEYPNAKLSWYPITVTGNTTGTAEPLPDGRVDNFGNDDTEIPPDVATTLSTHDAWTGFAFADGQPGSVKWFKKVITVDQTLTISGRRYDGFDNTGTPMYQPMIGLIVYKGANLASLTVATQQGSSVAAGMMVEDSDYFDSASHFGNLTSLPISGAKHASMVVPFTAGETAWIALFGVYEADTTYYPDATADDAPQFDIDLHIVSTQPPNDMLADAAANFDRQWYLSKSEWGEYYSYPLAGARSGTTVGASVEVGEPSDVLGFAATRSVWYELLVPIAGDWKIWVESSGDCTLSVYSADYPYNSFSLLTHVASDDDSGAGNWPELTLALPVDTYWIKVDSKADTTFTIKFQRVNVPGTPPANNNFASATVISSLPYSATGTTVGANAEPDERECQSLGVGPTDSVWYKWVATFDGHVSVWADCLTTNIDGYVQVDAWVGTSLATLARAPEPPRFDRGWFWWNDTAAQKKARAYPLDVVSGQTYYFRVQTEAGGSEDFNIYVEQGGAYLNLEVSAEEGGPFSDTATVDLRMGTSAVIEEHGITYDSELIPFKLTPAAVELKALGYFDTGSVYMNMFVIEEQDCYFHIEPSFIADGIRKWAWSESRKWSADGTRRWTWTEGEGLPQVC